MEGLEEVGGLGYSSTIGGLLLLLSDLDRARGDVDGARTRLRECLQRYNSPEHLGVIVEAAEAWAGIEASVGDARQAVWLFAATRGLRERAGRRLAGREAEWVIAPLARTQDLEVARGRLPTTLAEEAWESGMTSSIDEIVECVVGRHSPVPLRIG
jgi:hypothetical protein